MYKKILVPLDGSELAECVLAHIKNLSPGDKNPEIVLFRVCEPPVILADFPATLEEKWEDHVREETEHMNMQCSLYLNDVEKKLKDSGLSVTTRTALGKPAEQIIEYAAKNNVDVILMATHGRSGISRWAYGSIADKVLRSSPVPVMIIRPEECKEKM
jgi:nucleotide-binding universal stress UspA family protein